jgi:hypothetical protein
VKAGRKVSRGLVVVFCALVVMPAQKHRSEFLNSFELGSSKDTLGACLEWTDGCVNCMRPLLGKVTCSNIGIACQPEGWQCSRRTSVVK